MSRVITSTTYLSAQDDLGLAGTYPFTIFFYVKTTSIATTPQVPFRFYNQGSGSPSNYIACSIEEGNISARASQLHFRAATSDTLSTNDVWEPVCIIFDDGTGDSLTLDTEDGQYTNPDSNTLAVFSAPDIYIGNIVNNIYGLVGNIAHFTVWDSALSSGDVTSLINGADPATVDSPTRYWAFTDSSVTDSVASAVLTNSGTTNDDGDNPDFSLPILGQTAQIDVTITVDGDFPGAAAFVYPLTGSINTVLGVNSWQTGRDVQTGAINVIMGVNGTQSGAEATISAYKLQDVIFAGPRRFG